MYFDENGNYYTERELRREFNVWVASGNLADYTDAATFEEYIENCCSKDGTLTRMDRVFANDDGKRYTEEKVYAMYKREMKELDEEDGESSEGITFELWLDWQIEGDKLYEVTARPAKTKKYFFFNEAYKIEHIQQVVFDALRNKSMAPNNQIVAAMQDILDYCIIHEVKRKTLRKWDLLIDILIDNKVEDLSNGYYADMTYKEVCDKFKSKIEDDLTDTIDALDYFKSKEIERLVRNIIKGFGNKTANVTEWGKEFSEAKIRSLNTLLDYMQISANWKVAMIDKFSAHSIEERTEIIRFIINKEAEIRDDLVHADISKVDTIRLLHALFERATICIARLIVLYNHYAAHHTSGVVTPRASIAIWKKIDFEWDIPTYIDVSIARIKDNSTWNEALAKDIKFLEGYTDCL